MAEKLSCRRLRCMAVLAMAAACFACVHLGRQIKLAILLQRVYKAAKHIYGIPEFRSRRAAARSTRPAPAPGKASTCRRA